MYTVYVYIYMHILFALCRVCQESITYVNRVLAFMFATDDSFEKLMQLPKEPG